MEPGESYEVYDADRPGWVLCEVESFDKAPSPLPYPMLAILRPVSDVTTSSGLRQIYGVPWPDGQHLVRRPSRYR
jgi:hypothetical protein